MPPAKSPLWDHFLSGKKQNGSHVCAHCRGCIEKERPNGDIAELDDEGKITLSLSQSWVTEGKYYIVDTQSLANSTICDGKHAKKGVMAYSGSKMPWLPIFWEKVAIVHARTHPQKPGRPQEK